MSITTDAEMVAIRALAEYDIATSDFWMCTRKPLMEHIRSGKRMSRWKPETVCPDQTTRMHAARQVVYDLMRGRGVPATTDTYADPWQPVTTVDGITVCGRPSQGWYVLDGANRQLATFEGYPDWSICDALEAWRDSLTAEEGEAQEP